MLGVTPVQTAFSSIRRPAGDVAHLILSGPSVADIGYSELDLPAVMGVNGSIARRSHPHLRFAYYAMLDAGFVSRRRDLVADVLAQDLLLFVTPEVLRGSRSCFLRTTFVAASRSSKSAPARVPAPRAAGTIGEDAA